MGNERETNKKEREMRGMANLVAASVLPIVELVGDVDMRRAIYEELVVSMKVMIA